ncbi:2-hydroxyacid dehydrogenase [Mesorhizobium sp. SB112]|uniref:2-hydroxyacid dehydrogenase n=1 Tax=Mesorhizobium sp. SB112 TaxID=3151853 RepID=UPI003267242C
MINIVFHGQNAATYHDDFRAVLMSPANISILPAELSDAADISAFQKADVIIGNRFAATMPHPANVKLYHVAAAGYDGVDFSALPDSIIACNCFGHEQAIAEYVMAAILASRVPLAQADTALRKGEWPFRSGSASAAHREIGGSTLGLLGYGHIGKAIAHRAKAFGMRIHAANRSPVAPSHQVDAYFGFENLDAFYRSADFIVVSLPLLAETKGFVGADAFAAMRPDATILNVGRGPVIDEKALYDALASRRIGGAVIDTWYQYPAKEGDTAAPSSLPFHKLDNIVMTPHMSGWTDGTIRRRGTEIAANVDAFFGGGRCTNVIRGSQDAPKQAAAGLG